MSCWQCTEMKGLSAKAYVKVVGMDEGNCFLKYSCHSVLITASDLSLTKTLCRRPHWAAKNDLKFKSWQQGTHCTCFLQNLCLSWKLCGRQERRVRNHTRATLWSRHAGKLKILLLAATIQVLRKNQLRHQFFFCRRDKWLKITNKYLWIPFHH